MSAVDGERLVRVLHQVAVTIEENKDHLCRLDSDVGDGDHGVSMTIGMRAARRNLDDLQRPTPEAAFRAVAEAFADEVGAAIGPIYEEAFGAAADAVAGTSEIADADGWARVLEAMAAATQRVGGGSRTPARRRPP